MDVRARLSHTRPRENRQTCNSRRKNIKTIEKLEEPNKKRINSFQREKAHTMDFSPFSPDEGVIQVKNYEYMLLR